MSYSKANSNLLYFDYGVPQRRNVGLNLFNTYLFNTVAHFDRYSKCPFASNLATKNTPSKVNSSTFIRHGLIETRGIFY